VNSQKFICRILHSTGPIGPESSYGSTPKRCSRHEMLWCCIDMRLADALRENPLRLMGALGGGSSKSLPPSDVPPTSLAQFLCRTQKSLGGEFRVSPRNLLRGVSLPGGGTSGVGVDEGVEGASGRPPCSILLHVDQVEQAAQVCPFVEPHRRVARFDDLNQAPDEVEAVRTVIPLAVSSVDLHGNRLVHAFSPRRGGPAGTEGGKPRPNLAVTETLTP
jgi:hypothetical protein